MFFRYLLYIVLLFFAALQSCHSPEKSDKIDNKETQTFLLQGINYFEKGEDSSAVDLLEKYGKQATNRTDSTFTNAICALGYSCFRLGKYSKSDSCFSLLISEKNTKIDCFYLYLLGICKYQTGNYDKAILYFRQILDCKDALEQGMPYLSLADAYSDLITHKPQYKDSALFFYRKSIEIGEDNNSAYAKIATFYRTQEKEDSALFYFQKVISPYPEAYWFNYAKAWRGLAHKKANFSFFKKALFCYHNALGSATEKQEIGEIYNEIGFCYWELENVLREQNKQLPLSSEIDSAKMYFQKALPLISSCLDSIRNYSGRARIDLLSYNSSNKYQDLAESVHNFSKILALMPRLRKKLETETSKSILTDLLYNAYEPALEANYALYKSNPTPENLQSAYNFIQSSKALALREEMNQNQKNKTQNIDNQVKIADIQAKCKAENSVFVDYFQGKENVFIFYATAEKQGLIQRKCSAVAMDTLIPYYFQKMKDIALLSPELKNMYQKLSFRFYQSFWQELDSTFHSLSMPYPVKATLVLDGYLHKIPFDALHSDSLGKEYLIDKYNFSYAFSAHFWLENSENKQVDASIIAFAPVFDTSFYQKYVHSPNNFEKTLNETQHTLDSLQKKYEISTFLREEATKQRFFEVAPKYNIVHLATHGFADEENAANSFVALTPNSPQEAVQKGHLRLNEIYNSKMKAELALLTACETGKGQIKKGEGVMSLARAFRYAGCERVIMTLWSVNQASTMEITQKLYDNLAKGENYGDALYHAKKSYLLENEDYRKYPILWSGMVLVGNANGSCKIPAKTFFTPLNLMLGVFAMAVIAFLIWYLQKRKLRK